MTKENIKLKQKESVTWFSNLKSGFLDIHSHRYYRRSFTLCILLYIVTVLIPNLELDIPIPQAVKPLLDSIYQAWPFPTFKMTNSSSSEPILHSRNLLFKIFEITVIFLYTVDLVPKIFIWKKPFLWKLMNIAVVTMMVVQVPLTMRGYQESGMGVENLKIRTLSVGISLLLTLEIYSIREQQHLKTSKRKTSINYKPDAKRMFTWAEVIRHDKPGDCWIVVHGKVYDVTTFVDVHPGGPMIYDGAGGDCTAMWKSYHPVAMANGMPPEKYLIGEIRGYKDFYSYDGIFYSKIKERVEAKIPREKRNNDYRLFVKGAIILVGWFISLYYWIKYYDFITTIIFAFFSSQIGVNIMHDGNHGGYSTNKVLSYIAGATLDMMGSTSVVYRRSHNFGHHGCVNHFELDRAFDTSYPIFRMHKFQKKMPYHKYQHIYMWLVYGFVNFGDVFGTFDELAWMSNYPTRRGHITKTAFYSQVLVKIAFISYTMIIPSFIHGWYHVFPYWFLFMMVFSYGYALFFAINHWTEEANQTDNSNISNTNWGVLQVENSSNFATDSWFWTNLSGGLNYQIEHHLFPSLAHTRTPEIKQIVVDICKEYNIRYFEFKSFWDAMLSHYRFLKKMGNAEEE